MPERPEYDLEKLAREIVASRLPEIKRTPRAAAEIARKILVAAIKSTRVRQEPRVTVRGVCRGVMAGLFMIGKDLPEAAARVLGELATVAHEVQLDPGDVMTWGMEGVADVAILAGDEQRVAIQSAIESQFMGAGAAFSGICEKARPKS